MDQIKTYRFKQGFQSTVSRDIIQAKRGTAKGDMNPLNTQILTLFFLSAGKGGCRINFISLSLQKFHKWQMEIDKMIICIGNKKHFPQKSPSQIRSPSSV